MNCLKPISGRIEVGPVLAELAANPKLWDAFDFRTDSPVSPHRELSDIIVRYNARENFTGDRAAFNEPHESVWYPCVRELPSVIPIALEVMHLVEGERLGMVLITRIPAHKECYAHRDVGWHARYYDKYAVQLASAPGQAFCFEGESLSAEPGEIYSFENSQVHWVTNDSDFERMTMIICVRNRFTGAH